MSENAEENNLNEPEELSPEALNEANGGGIFDVFTEPSYNVGDEQYMACPNCGVRTLWRVMKASWTSTEWWCVNCWQARNFHTCNGFMNATITEKKYGES